MLCCVVVVADIVVLQWTSSNETGNSVADTSSTQG